MIDINRYKAYIFDFDGVVMDTESLHFKAWNKGFSLLGDTLTEEEYGVAFRKGSDLCTELNKFMDKIIADGTFKALGEKYDLSVVTE